MEACRVIDGRLAARLTAELGRKISFFLTPAEAPEHAGHVVPKPDRAFMPFVRFPNWYFCPRCRVLKHIPWNSQSGGAHQCQCVPACGFHGRSPIALWSISTPFRTCEKARG